LQDQKILTTQIHNKLIVARFVARSKPEHSGCADMVSIRKNRQLQWPTVTGTLLVRNFGHKNAQIENIRVWNHTNW